MGFIFSDSPCVRLRVFGGSIGLVSDWCWTDIRKNKDCDICGISLEKQMVMAFSDGPRGTNTKFFCEKCGVKHLQEKYPKEEKRL